MSFKRARAGREKGCPAKVSKTGSSRPRLTRAFGGRFGCPGWTRFRDNPLYSGQGGVVQGPGPKLDSNTSTLLSTPSLPCPPKITTENRSVGNRGTVGTAALESAGIGTHPATVVAEPPVRPVFN